MTDSCIYLRQDRHLDRSLGLASAWSSAMQTGQVVLKKRLMDSASVQPTLAGHGTSMAHTRHRGIYDRLSPSPIEGKWNGRDCFVPISRFATRP